MRVFAPRRVQVVEAGGVVRARPVTVHHEDAERLYVSDGLADGEKVCVQAAPALEGVRVEPAAGGPSSAALAGTLAAHTNLPVIGIPLDASTLSGVDALHACVQMPPGFPVATVAIGGWGATNSALLAARILALSDEELAARLADQREGMRTKTVDADARLQKDRGDA